MTQTPRDPGDLLEVPEDEWLDVDEGEGANAIDDETGADDDLDDIYADPGELVEQDLG